MALNFGKGNRSIAFAPTAAFPLNANSYFEDYDFSKNQINSLYQYESVTPGDFGVVMDKIRFMSSEKVSSQLICDELRNIQEEKNNGEFCKNSKRTVGFAM